MLPALGARFPVSLDFLTVACGYYAASCLSTLLPASAADSGACSSGALAALYPMRIKLVKIPTDLGGLVPEELGALLDQWDETKVGLRPVSLGPATESLCAYPSNLACSLTFLYACNCVTRLLSASNPGMLVPVCRRSSAASRG